MPIIALTNQKGGCGKSSTGVHLCAWLDREGKDVALVDADAQRSSSLWLGRMESQIPVHIISGSDELLEQIPEIAAKHAFVIVDGPAGLSESVRAILLRADLAIVPTQPTGMDLQSASEAFRVVRQAQSVRNGPPQAFAFISRAVKGTRLKTEAISLLQKWELPTFKTIVHQRQVVADCFSQASVVWEMSGRLAADATREYEQLFTEIVKAL